jgi:hypothetical protein
MTNIASRIEVTPVTALRGESRRDRDVLRPLSVADALDVVLLPDLLL